MSNGSHAFKFLLYDIESGVESVCNFLFSE